MAITLEGLQDQIPAYLTQEDKINLVRSLQNFPHIKYLTGYVDDDPLQGDGWAGLEVLRFIDGQRKFVKGIVLSNSCDINPHNRRDMPVRILYAPLIRLPKMVELLRPAGLGEHQILDKVQSIREQKVSSIFYLPQEGPLEDEYVAFLDDIYSVPIDCFNTNHQKRRMFTLSQTGFYIFLFKLSIHFCRFFEKVHRDQTQSKQ